MVNIYLGRDIEFDFNQNDIMFNASNDFSIIEDVNNLQQAIFNRLLTKIGDLKSNPTYGSNLHLIIGKNRDDLTLGEAALYIQEALDHEDRIDLVTDLSLSWEQLVNGQWKLVMNITLIPNAETTEQNIIINYNV